MYRVIQSKAFRKSLTRISRHKDFSETSLRFVINIIENEQTLPEKYRDHELQGDMKGIRECHVQNDILLMYRKEKDVLVLMLVDIGTHSSLFD